jgi:hypothetical protein
MRTIKVYSKEDLYKFGENTPEYFSDYSSKFLERYNIQEKPKDFNFPENELKLGYLIESLGEQAITDLNFEFERKSHALIAEQQDLEEKLKENRKSQLFYKKSKAKIKNCKTFVEVFEILMK